MHLSSPLRLVVSVAALALALAACGGSDDGDGGGSPTGTDAPSADLGLITEGTLTVCSDVPYPPFEDEDPSAPSGYTGFDIEVMQAIADGLGLELAVIDSGFDAIQSGAVLNSEQCDVAASAMTITEEREESLDFTEPYFDAKQSLLTTTDSGISALADLDGKVLGVQAETTGETYATENAPVTPQSYPSAAELFQALDSGQIDAILQDLPVNAERARDSDDVEVVEEYDTGEQYGFAVAEEDSEALLEALNAELAALRDDGTYDELYEKYFSAE